MLGIDAAIEFVVGKYSQFETDSICPYISKRIGIAEWIVRRHNEKIQAKENIKNRIPENQSESYMVCRDRPKSCVNLQSGVK